MNNSSKKRGAEQKVDEDFVEEQKCTPVIKRSDRRPAVVTKLSQENTNSRDVQIDEDATAKTPEMKSAVETPIELGEFAVSTPVTLTPIRDETPEKSDYFDMENKSACQESANVEEGTVHRLKKKKKKRRDYKAKSDDNNAVGQVCNDDVSFEEDKKNKKKKSPIAQLKEENNVVGQIYNDDNDEEDKKKKKRKREKDRERVKPDAEERKKPIKLVEKRSNANLVPEERKADTSVRYKVKPDVDKRDRSRRAPVVDVSARKMKVKQVAERPKSKRSDRKYIPVMIQQKKKELKPEGFFKSLISKAKTTLNASLNLANKGDDTFISNPETNLKVIDVNAEYGGPEDTGPPPEKSYDNFNNNGNLFPNGRPFWCNKDEKPPSSNNYVMTVAMRDLTEGKWSLLPSMREPTDLDPTASLESMQTRDAEYFKKDKRVLSNTVRSLVTIYDYKHRIKKGTVNSNSFREPANVVTPRYSMSFTQPKQLVQYYRKNRMSPMIKVNYTPGIAQKTKKKKPKTIGGDGSVRVSRSKSDSRTEQG